MADKSLKFSFVLDDQSFQRVKRALDELIVRSQQLAKTLAGVGMPGGSVGGGMGLMGGGSVGRPGSSSQQMAQGPSAQVGIGKVILDNANAFKSMANVGMGSMKALNDAVKRSVADQQRDVDTLKKHIHDLGNAYEGLSRKAGGGDSKAALAAQHLQRRIIENRSNLLEKEAGIAELRKLGGTGADPTKSPAPTYTPGKSGGMGLLTPIGGGAINLGNPMAMVQQFMNSSAMGAVIARSVGLLAAGATGAINTAQGWNNAELDMKAQRGKILGGAWQRSTRGDISDSLAIAAVRGMGHQSQQEFLARFNSAEAKASRLARGAAQVGADVGKSLVGMGPTAPGASLTGAGLDNAFLEDRQGAIDMVKNTIEYQKLARGSAYMDETSGSRRLATRILGRGINRTRDAKGNVIPGNWSDSFSGWNADLVEKGYSGDEMAQAVVHARGVGGERFANRYAGNVMGGSAAGYDLASPLAAAARSQGIGGAGAFVSSALGLGGGKIDTTMALQLAQGLGGFDPRGTVSGMGALQAISGGFAFGNGNDPNMVQRAMLGMQGGDKLFGGSISPYQKGMNTISAITAMPGGSTYAQDALAGLGTKELLALANGDPSAMGTAMGIGKKEAKAQIAGATHGLFSQWYDQGGTSPLDVAMRQMQNSGKSETEFIQGLGSKARKGDKNARAQLEALGVGASVLSGGQIGVEEGMGMIGIEAGMGVKGLKGKNMPWGGSDDAQKEKDKQTADNLRKSASELQASMEIIVKALQATQSNQKTLEGEMGNLGTAVDQTTRDFLALHGVMSADWTASRRSNVVKALINALAPGDKAGQDAAARKQAEYDAKQNPAGK